MALSQETGGVDPDYCADADEYVIRRLSETDSAMSPSEMSEEYGCSNGHMRNTMAELASNGVIERVSPGKYVSAVEADSRDDGERPASFDEIVPDSDESLDGEANANTDDVPESEGADDAEDDGSETTSSDEPASDDVDEGDDVDDEDESVEAVAAGAAATAAAAPAVMSAFYTDEGQLNWSVVVPVALLGILFLMWLMGDGESDDDQEEQTQQYQPSTPQEALEMNRGGLQ